MVQKPEKFRLRLNLFDSIVLLAALVVGAFLLWNALRPEAAAEGAASSTVRYTICLQRCVPGTAGVIREGARLTDSVRNYEMGRVVSAEAIPATDQALDSVEGRYIRAALEGYEDVLVVAEAPCTITEEAVTVGGGYPLRVGGTAYVQGDGFLGSGYIYAIERED